MIRFCTGLDCDFSRYPERSVQDQFFRSYLHNERTGEEPSQTQLDALYREVNPFALASHLCWGLWAVVMARLSKIDFDYIGYAQKRFDEYWRRRDELLALCKS